MQANPSRTSVSTQLWMSPPAPKMIKIWVQMVTEILSSLMKSLKKNITHKLQVSMVSLVQLTSTGNRACSTGSRSHLSRWKSFLNAYSPFQFFLQKVWGSHTVRTSWELQIQQHTLQLNTPPTLNTMRLSYHLQ